MVLVLHGGAGAIRREVMGGDREARYEAALGHALSVGWEMLRNGAEAVDTVEMVVRALEDEPLFNAGRGSVFTHEGNHEMDASLMDGRDLRVGCVSAVRNIRNPVALARAVMDRSPYVFLHGAGAEEFARIEHIAFEPDQYFFDQYRYNQFQQTLKTGGVQLDHSDNEHLGTVGAVALDGAGNLAAATSTGGMTNKQFGRVGDSPIIGAGTYADNRTCGVSCTGHGEFFIRAVAAYEVSALLHYGGLPLAEAADRVIRENVARLGGTGGLIAIDREGNIAMPFNTEGMFRAWIDREGEAHTAMFG